MGETKKKFLLVGPLPPPIGGDTIFNLALSESNYWVENGIELEVLDTSPHGELRLPQDRLKLGDVFRGIKLFFELLWKIPTAKFVLIFSNTRFVLTMGPMIWAVARILRKPVAAWLFSTYFVKRFQGTPSFWRSIARSFLNGVEAIFCQTRLLERHLIEEVGINPGKIVFFPNFVQDHLITQKLEDRDFRGRCVYVGQVKREKGVFDIIEALNGDERFTCDFYGPIHERDTDEFMREVENRGNLSYRGLVDHEDVVKTISSYDVFLFPSFHPSEGYPAVIFESYASGVPVIASDWLALGEIVTDGVTGILVPPKQPEAIVEALEKLLNEGELYKKMRGNALDFALKHSEKIIIEGILIKRLKTLVRD